VADTWIVWSMLIIERTHHGLIYYLVLTPYWFWMFTTEWGATLAIMTCNSRNQLYKGLKEINVNWLILKSTVWCDHYAYNVQKKTSLKLTWLSRSTTSNRHHVCWRPLRKHGRLWTHGSSDIHVWIWWNAKYQWVILWNLVSIYDEIYGSSFKLQNYPRS